MAHHRQGALVVSVLVLVLWSSSCRDPGSGGTTASPPAVTTGTSSAITQPATTRPPDTREPTTAPGRDGVVVADFGPPGRAFSVTASDDGRCIEVTAGEASEVSCALPLSAGLGVTIIGVAGEQHLVGLLTDPAITEIALTPREVGVGAEQVVIVDVGGGVRAFAARTDPGSLAAVEGRDEAHRLVTRVDL